MLYAGKTLDYIPFVDNLYWLSSFLIIASAFQNKQDLTTGMAVPIQLCRPPQKLLQQERSRTYYHLHLIL